MSHQFVCVVGEETEIQVPCRTILTCIKEWFEALGQTLWLLSAMTWGTISLIGSPILFYYGLTSKYWVAVVAYLLWMFYDRKTPYKDGYKIQFFRYVPCFKAVANYYSAKLIKTVDLSPDTNYIFGFHPHGALCYSFQGNFMYAHSNAEMLFPGLRMRYATLGLFFYAPFFRELQIGSGAVSASRETLERILGGNEKGNMLILYIGGSTENSYAVPGKYQIILKKRKGFIKLALKTGCSLVPVIGFGENEIFNRLELYPESKMYKIATWVQKCTGHFPNLVTNIVPKRVQLTTVVGKPIKVPKIMDATNEDVEYYHSVYTEQLINLFNEHRSLYLKNGANIELTLIE